MTHFIGRGIYLSLIIGGKMTEVKNLKGSKILVLLNTWAVGGAERGWYRIAGKLSQYDWAFKTEVEPADLIFYSNDHRFYEAAKKLNVPIIQRTTGPRSYNLPQPDDLAAVVCSSQKAFELSAHPKKTLIYNGVDFERLRGIKEIECDLLYPASRIGVGQKVETAILYALKHNRRLTITGAKQHLAENTHDLLRAKYPQMNWTGLVDEETMLGLIKGCRDVIMPTSTHGISNAIIEAVGLEKNIINLGSVEVPRRDQIDLNETARKYDELIKGVLNGQL
jgi:hypothetical protein